MFMYVVYSRNIMYTVRAVLSSSNLFITVMYRPHLHIYFTTLAINTLPYNYLDIRLIEMLTNRLLVELLL